MNASKNTLWWKKPKRTVDLTETRRVTFLELFHDLVYVVIVSELAHALALNMSAKGILTFIFLFIIVWWAWLNGTMYHELHGHNDVRTRVFTFLLMFTLAGMAIFTSHALSEGSTGFAISYASFQLVMAFLWWRTGVHDPAHRPLSTPYVGVFLISSLLFIASIFLVQSYTIPLWSVGLFLSFMLPANSNRLAKKNKAIREEWERSIRIRPSLVERFGLFIIIVLGEVIIKVISALSKHPHLEPKIYLLAALGILIAISMWWIYFDYVSYRTPSKEIKKRYGWTFLHLPMAMAIVASGAGIFYVIENDIKTPTSFSKWLLILSIVIFLLCIRLITSMIDIEELHSNVKRVGQKMILISMLVLCVVGFLKLSNMSLFLIINGLLLLPILIIFKLWTRALEKPVNQIILNDKSEFLKNGR